MATPPSDDSRTLFKLLADGEWHSYTVIRDALARTVPPGRAIRRYEERLSYSREFLTGKGGPQRNPSEDEKIELGQRACAQRIITSWKGRGVQAQGEGEDKKIRLKPGFRSWGVDVTVPAQTGEDSAGYTDVPPEPVEPSEEDLSKPQSPPADSPVLPDAEPAPQRAQVEAPKAPAGEHVPPAGEDPYAWPSQKVAAPQWPECPQCGLMVINQARHDEWHAGMNGPAQRPEMALLDENAMRTLLGDVMGLVLDKFQGGMEQYLEDRFNDVESRFVQLEGLFGSGKRAGSRWIDRTRGDSHRG